MPNESSLSDAILLHQLRQGADDAATQLYRRYADRLLRLASQRAGQKLSSRLDPEDIVQSVFRTFFRRASAGHYQLPEGEELWKLFLVISLNKIRKKVYFNSAAKRDIAKTQAIGERELSTGVDPTDVLKLTIDELVAALPSEHQQVLRDRIQGYEVAEIAHRSELSKRTVERILQSFRARLRQELESVE